MKIIGKITDQGEIVSRKQNGYYLVKTDPGVYKRYSADDLNL